MSHTLGLHHVTQRKKAPFRKLLNWVHKDRSIDDAMIAVAFLYPLTMVPQAWKIFEIQDASSISATSFALKMFFAIPWILYGVKHKSHPVIISNVLWFASYTVILVQTAVY